MSNWFGFMWFSKPIDFNFCIIKVIEYNTKIKIHKQNNIQHINFKLYVYHNHITDTLLYVILNQPLSLILHLLHHLLLFLLQLHLSLLPFFRTTCNIFFRSSYNILPLSLSSRSFLFHLSRSCSNTSPFFLTTISLISLLHVTW